MESQIFIVLKVRLGSGRKSFSKKKRATYLAKVCASKVENNGNIEIEKIEKPIEIDNSVKEWIKAIEENIRATRNVIINSKFMKDIMKMKKFTEMKCSF